MVFDTVSAPARTPARIAFTGLSGCGKDSAAQPLLARGYQRACFGDVIKGIFDAQCRELLGFSAFTEHRPDKEKIRPLLVHGGDVFYDEVERRAERWRANDSRIQMRREPAILSSNLFP